MAKTINVAVGSNNDPLNWGIESVVGKQRDMRLVGIAKSKEQFEGLANDQQIDVSLLHLQLPRNEKPDCLRGMAKKNKNEIARLIMTNYPESYVLSKGCFEKRDAQGVIDLTQDGKNFSAAIRTVAEGKLFVPKHLQELFFQDLREGGSPIASISDRELDVLKLIVKGMPTRDIANQLGISEKTVSTHCDRLKRKLRADNIDQLRFAVVQYAKFWL